MGKDTRVYNTWFDDNGGWSNQWVRNSDPHFSDDFTLPLNTPIAALARTTTHMDLFAVGKGDDAVWSTFYDDNYVPPQRPIALAADRHADAGQRLQ